MMPESLLVPVLIVLALVVLGIFCAVGQTESLEETRQIENYLSSLKNPRTWKLISAQGQLLGMDVSGDAPPVWTYPPGHLHYIDPKHEAEWVEDREDCCIELGFSDYLVEEFHAANIYLPGERDDSRRTDLTAADS